MSTLDVVERAQYCPHRVATSVLEAFSVHNRTFALSLYIKWLDIPLADWA